MRPDERPALTERGATPRDRLPLFVAWLGALLAAVVGFASLTAALAVAVVALGIAFALSWRAGDQARPEAFVAAAPPPETRGDRSSSESTTSLTGALIGSLSHDLNNLLTVIMSHSERLIGGLPDGSPLVESAEKIERAARRSASLTQELLAFGRAPAASAEPNDLVDLLDGISPVLRDVLGEPVGLEIRPFDSPLTILMGRAPFEQIVLNLVVNARQAMPDGGTLTLTARPVQLDAEQARDQQLEPGPYAEIVVADTGIGITPEIRSRLFEPFFTTRSVEEGSGLGLATASRLLRHVGGTITVLDRSEPGAAFRILVPRAI